MLDKEKDEDPESQLLINTQSQLQQKAVEDAAAKEASPRVQFWVLSIWMIK